MNQPSSPVDALRNVLRRTGCVNDEDTEHVARACLRAIGEGRVAREELVHLLGLHAADSVLALFAEAGR